jgi:Family of unknown function (DUF6529)
VALIGVLSIGVAAALFAYGRVHQANISFSLFGQAHPITLKSLLATVALGLAVVQVLLALWIYRKLPLAGAPPRRVPTTHRVVGFVLFALTLPIAIHCIMAYGVQVVGTRTVYGTATSARVMVHSLAGCFFYGAFVAKVLLVQTRRLPKWVLPVAGGALAVTIAVLWYTSALWYYNGFQLPHL